MKNKSTIKFPAGILIWMGFKQNLAKNLRDQKRKQKDKQTTIKNYSPLVVIAVIGKNHYESEKKGKKLKNFETIFATLTYRLGGKVARRPTPKWNTRFHIAFSIRTQLWLPQV